MMKFTEAGHALMTTQIKQASWPDSHTFWRDKRVIITGGSGFLGSFVVDKLKDRGAADIFVPRKRDYDPSTLLRAGLVQREAALQLLAGARPDLIIHLAASVGGIGTNLNPDKRIASTMNELYLDSTSVLSRFCRPLYTRR